MITIADAQRQVARLDSTTDFHWKTEETIAENGVSESTMLALMGHMSCAMLERYSHIRMTAKRDAVEAVRLHPAEQNSEVVPVKVPVLGQTAKVQ